LTPRPGLPFRFSPRLGDDRTLAETQQRAKSGVTGVSFGPAGAGPAGRLAG
jgi:hypothetical protein